MMNRASRQTILVRNKTLFRISIYGTVLDLFLFLNDPKSTILVGKIGELKNEIKMGTFVNNKKGLVIVTRRVKLLLLFFMI